MKMKTRLLTTTFFTILLFTGQAQRLSFSYTVTMDDPEWHFFHVELICSGIRDVSIDFKMPVWTPGYYQHMNYADNVKEFKAFTSSGSEIKWEKINENTWRVNSGRQSSVRLTYDVKAERAFVASPYLDEHRAYILPAGTFLFVENMINRPVQIKVVPYENWQNVATGLDSVKGKRFE